MRGRLDEAFFEQEPHRPERRPWVLPLAPVLVVWLSAWLMQEIRAGVLSSTDPGPLRPLAGAPSHPAAQAVPLRGGPARRIRYALTLLARGEPARARTILVGARSELGDEPFILRNLARAERALGHREQAAELYVLLLQARADDRDALEFFLAYRYEEDDLAGAMAVAEELDALGALEGEAALLAQRVRAEQVERALARRSPERPPVGLARRPE